VQGEHSEAVVVEVRDLEVHACLDEFKNVLGQTMALGFRISSI
jgi:hypothetical protein